MFLSSWTSLSFGYSFNETYHVSECWCIQKISFSFLSGFSARHYFGIWVSSYPKLCSWFFDEQRQFLMRLHHSRNKRQLTYLPLSENSPRADFLGGLFLGTKYGRRPASPPTHTWLIESEALPRLHHPAMIERVGERDSLSFHYSAYYNRPLILACYRRQLTAKCIRASYFLVTTSASLPLQRIVSFEVRDIRPFLIPIDIVHRIMPIGRFFSCDLH